MRTLSQLEDAARVRWQVFKEERGLLSHAGPAIGREVDPFDTLPTTISVVTYAGSTPVGTARMLMHNPEVARANGYRLGVPMEQHVAIMNGPWLNVQVAEISRLAVLDRWRGWALLKLFAAMYKESRRWGLTHWVGATSVETDSPSDAALAYEVASHQKLVSAAWRVEARKLAAPSAPPSRPIYTPEQRRLARRGQLCDLRLPRTLGLMVKMVAARFSGEPFYNSYFRTYSMPLVIDLDTIPATILKLATQRRRARR